MTFKRSMSCGLAGGLLTSLIGFGALFTNKSVEHACTDLFLGIGLNPREQAPLCLSLVLAITALAGFLLGRGVRVREPRS